MGPDGSVQLNLVLHRPATGALARAGVVAALAVLALALLAAPVKLCLVAAVLHVPCPGCGLTRAAFAMASGDFTRAFALHPLASSSFPRSMDRERSCASVLRTGRAWTGARPSPWSRVFWRSLFSSSPCGSPDSSASSAVPFRFDRASHPHALHALDVEAKVHHVAVAHDVVLALDGNLAGLAALCLAAVAYEIVPPDDLGTDEPFLEIGVDLTGRARRGGSPGDRPSVNFGVSCGEKCDEPSRSYPARITPKSPGSFKPALARNSGRSAGSSSAICASSAAQIGITRALSACAAAARRAKCRLCDRSASDASSTFAT